MIFILYIAIVKSSVLAAVTEWAIQHYFHHHHGRPLRFIIITDPTRRPDALKPLKAKRRRGRDM